jgi:hypothetical protein
LYEGVKKFVWEKTRQTKQDVRRGGRGGGGSDLKTSSVNSP